MLRQNRQGEIIKNLDMSAVGRGQVDILNQGNFFQDVLGGVAPVDPSGNDSDGQLLLVSKKDNDRHHEELVHFAGDICKLRSGVCFRAQANGEKQKGMDVGFYSNASLLNEELSKGIINARLDSITISFDGATKETYEKIRKNLKFEVTKKNVLGLINTKKKLNKKNPKVNLVLVELEENKREIKQFYKYWKGKVDGINIINMRKK